MTIEKTPGPVENNPSAAPSESASPVPPVAAPSVQSDIPLPVASPSAAGEAPKKKGGARPGAGRKPGPQKAKAKAGPPPSPLSGAPEAQLAEAIASAPPEVREALTALADPMKLAPLLHGGVESAAVAVARTRYGDKAEELRADKAQLPLMHTAVGMYIASLNVTLTPVQLLVGISLLVYAPKVAALEGSRRKALPNGEKVQDAA